MESNVRDEFYEPVEAVNKTAIGAHVQTYHPTTANISGGAISGQVVFELNTGAGEYLDLFKTHLQLHYRLIAAAGPAFTWAVGDCPLSNIFARGQLYINGKKVASSQNWTQDAVLSKRISFSRTYNASVNGFTYATAGADSVGAVAPNGITYTDDEYLDALFIRDESCIIPPNSNVRLLLDVDSAYEAKMGQRTRNVVVGTMSVEHLRLIAYTVVKAGGHPKEHVINLITLNSFLSSITNAAENRQYQVSSTIVKAAVSFLSTAYAADAAGKVQAGNLLTYVGQHTAQGMAGASGLIGLDFKLNNINVPNSRWDFSDYGYREAYLNFINETGGISDSAGKETYDEWLAYGPIHVANIVKPESDKSNSLQINAQFSATTVPAPAFMIITSLEENAVRFKYEPNSGVLLTTETLM